MLQFLLPDKLAQIIKSVDLSAPPPPQLTIGLAAKLDDYVEAGQLVYDSFQRRKLPFTHPNKLRLIPQMIAPTTAVLVVRSGPKLIGTATIVQQNPLGFPAERLANQSEWEKFAAGAKGPIIEVCNLAVAAEYIGKPATVFFPLAAYIYRFAKEFLKADRVAICVQPSLVDFYRALFGFDFLGSEDPRPFILIGDIQAIPLKASISKFEEWVKKKLARGSNGDALKQLFLERPKTDPAFTYPSHEFRTNISQPKSASILEELFVKQTDLLSNLPIESKSSLSQLYPSTDDYRWVFEADPRISRRKTRRFLTNLPTEIFKDGNSLSTGLILDVSESGLRLKANKTDLTLKVGDMISFAVSISEKVDTSLKAKIVWIKPDASYGLEIVEYDSRYQQYIRWLKQM